MQKRNLDSEEENPKRQKIESKKWSVPLYSVLFVAKLIMKRMRTIVRKSLVKYPTTADENGCWPCAGKCGKLKLPVEFVARPKNQTGLDHVCRACRNEQRRLRNPGVPIRVVEDDLWKCNVCHQLKAHDMFCKHSYNPSGHATRCKECSRQDLRKRSQKLWNFVQRLTISAKHGAKAKKREFELTYEIVLQMWLQQRGRCAYSGHRLQMRPHTLWTASLERICDDGGYTIDNVALVAQRFNTVGKWTRSKFLQVPNKSNEIFNIQNFKNDIEEAKTTCPVFINGIQSLRNFMLAKFDNARHRTKQKNKLGRNLDFNITYEYLLELALTQGGRCYYSGIPMNFQSKTCWMCSLERIDNTKGYIIGNVCFICQEFNTADRSINAALQSEVQGTAQWTKQLVSEVWPQIVRE